MRAVLILNGPNLNLLGTREPSHYGAASLSDVEVICREAGAKLGWAVECLQSNHEGALIDALHAAGARHAASTLVGVVFNAGAYTHTSVALHDAIKAVAPMPVIEVHISNVHAREAFRHVSLISPVAAGIVIGWGVDGYVLALDGLARKTSRESPAKLSNSAAPGKLPGSSR